MPSEAVNIIISAKDRATGAVDQVRRGITGLGDSAEKANAGLGRIAAVFGSLRTVLKLVTGDFQGIRDEVDGLLGIPLSEYIETAGESFGGWIYDVPQQMQKINTEANSLTARLQRYNDEVDRLEARDARVDKILGPLREQVELWGKSADEITEYRLKLAGANQEQLNAARQLRRFMVAQQEKIDADNDALVAAEKLQQQQQRQSDINRNYVTALRLQVVELTQGSEAADRMRVAMSGVSAETYRQSDALRAQIATLKEQQDQQADAQALLKQYATPLQEFEQEYERIIRAVLAGNLAKPDARRIRDELLQGFEDEQQAPELQTLQATTSRFLTRGENGPDIPRQQLALAKKQVEMQGKLKEVMERIETELTNAEDQPKLTVIRSARG